MSRCQWDGTSSPAAPWPPPEPPPRTERHASLSPHTNTESVPVFATADRRNARVERANITSVGISELSASEETKVACPGPQSLGLPKAESGVEVICLEALLPINGVVATGTVRRGYPDLHNDRKADERGWKDVWILNNYNFPFGLMGEKQMLKTICQATSTSTLPVLGPATWIHFNRFRGNHWRFSKSLNLSLYAPHLPKMWISQRASGLWVDDDDPHSWQDLKGEKKEKSLTFKTIQVAFWFCGH